VRQRPARYRQIDECTGTVPPVIAAAVLGSRGLLLVSDCVILRLHRSGLLQPWLTAAASRQKEQCRSRPAR
jgi:hypothetical protein